jgi:hypothetical protein
VVAHKVNLKEYAASLKTIPYKQLNEHKLQKLDFEGMLQELAENKYIN